MRASTVIKMEIEPLLVSIPQTSQVIGRCVATVYELLGSGQLIAVKSDGRTLVTMESIKGYVATLPKATIAPRPKRKPQHLRPEPTPMRVTDADKLREQNRVMREGLTMARGKELEPLRVVGGEEDAARMTDAGMLREQNKLREQNRLMRRMIGDLAIILGEILVTLPAEFLQTENVRRAVALTESILSALERKKSDERSGTH